MKKFITILTLSVVCVMFSLTVYASAYEWITNLAISGFNNKSSDPFDVYWTTNTSSTFYEYRTVCMATTTVGAAEPTTGWTDVTNCHIAGNVTGSVNDHCVATSTKVASTSTLWIRATTNYSGCGTYTCTPDIVSCGDRQTTSSPIYP